MQGYNKKIERGFTLVELMAVLVIISILVSVVIYINPFASDDARVAATKLQINELAKPLNEYKGKHGSYPDTLEDLVSANLMQEIPKDAWGNDFVYIKGGTYNGSKKYDLISLGADKTQGGSGYDADIINGQFKDVDNAEE